MNDSSTGLLRSRTILVAGAGGAAELHLVPTSVPASAAAEFLKSRGRIRVVNDGDLAGLLPTVAAVYQWSQDAGAPELLLSATASREPELWTASQCAEYLGIARTTWTAYVYRPARRNPAPQPVKNHQRSPLWDPQQVKDFGARRRVRHNQDPDPSDHEIASACTSI
ncbi:helix-turn-helix transcriptional regulator [Gordonia sihwensis]|uniref:helix-turn-helix transcriptional regulator n=1 Tax=Gordonia sihwensis TaxID=173559 RepID=UPI003D962944